MAVRCMCAAACDAGEPQMIRLLIANCSLLTRRDIAAILFVVAIVGGLLFVHVVVPNLGRSNQGFGPDWDCTNPGEGNSICIKKPPVKLSH